MLLHGIMGACLTGTVLIFPECKQRLLLFALQQFQKNKIFVHKVMFINKKKLYFMFKRSCLSTKRNSNFRPLTSWCGMEILPSISHPNYCGLPEFLYCQIVLPPNMTNFNKICIIINKMKWFTKGKFGIWYSASYLVLKIIAFYYI